MGCSLEKSVAEELIIGYAARTLDPTVQADFERHLDDCTSCRDSTAQQRTVWLALEDWHPHPVSPEFDRILAQRMELVRASGWSHRIFANWAWRPLLPVAAACAVLIFAFLLKESSRGSSVPDKPSVRIEQQVEHALDDMDMLKQIGVDVSTAKPGRSQKI